MEKTIFKFALFLLLFVSFSCNKPFEINSDKEYSPNGLRDKAETKCGKPTPWADKMVTVVGEVDGINVYENNNGGEKFRLKEIGAANATGSGLEVYVRESTSTEMEDIFRFVKSAGARTIKVQGKAVIWEGRTQIGCKQGIQIEISEASQLSFK